MKLSTLFAGVALVFAATAIAEPIPAAGTDAVAEVDARGETPQCHQCVQFVQHDCGKLPANYFCRTNTCLKHKNVCGGCRICGWGNGRALAPRKNPKQNCLQCTKNVYGPCGTWPAKRCAMINCSKNEDICFGCRVCELSPSAETDTDDVQAYENTASDADKQTGSSTKRTVKAHDASSADISPPQQQPKAMTKREEDAMCDNCSKTTEHCLEEPIWGEKWHCIDTVCATGMCKGCPKSQCAQAEAETVASRTIAARDRAATQMTCDWCDWRKDCERLGDKTRQYCESTVCQRNKAFCHNCPAWRSCP